MGVVERVGHCRGNAHRLIHRELFLAFDPFLKSLAFEVGHDVEQEAVRLAGIVERQDVRMREVGRGFDLGQETLGTDHGSEFRLQNFERHLAVVLQVVGQVDRGHAALTEFALDGVAAFESRVEAGDGIGHGGQYASNLCKAARIWKTGSLSGISRGG